MIITERGVSVTSLRSEGRMPIVLRLANVSIDSKRVLLRTSSPPESVGQSQVVSDFIMLSRL